MMGKRVGALRVNFDKAQGGNCETSECLNLKSVRISRRTSTAKNTPVGNVSDKISALLRRPTTFRVVFHFFPHKYGDLGLKDVREVTVFESHQTSSTAREVGNLLVCLYSDTILLQSIVC
jgi:hypothetical protein